MNDVLCAIEDLILRIRKRSGSTPGSGSQGTISQNCRLNRASTPLLLYVTPMGAKARSKSQECGVVLAVPQTWGSPGAQEPRMLDDLGERHRQGLGWVVVGAVGTAKHRGGSIKKSLVAEITRSSE